MIILRFHLEQGRRETRFYDPWNALIDKTMSIHISTIFSDLDISISQLLDLR